MAAIYDLPPLAVYEWMEANKKRLLKDEREMVAKAFDGAVDYYDGVDTDEVPEGFGLCQEIAYDYYDTRYGK